MEPQKSAWWTLCCVWVACVVTPLLYLPMYLIPSINPRPPCSSTKKKKEISESYIFYKLSAVKEGAKNPNHKYCTQLSWSATTAWCHLLRNQWLSAADFRSTTWNSMAKGIFSDLLNVKTLTRKRLWHGHIEKECLQCTFFFLLDSSGGHHLRPCHLKLAAKLK